jgi:hypothetical protein
VSSFDKGRRSSRLFNVAGASIAQPDRGRVAVALAFATAAQADLDIPPSRTTARGGRRFSTRRCPLDDPVGGPTKLTLIAATTSLER